MNSFCGGGSTHEFILRWRVTSTHFVVEGHINSFCGGGSHEFILWWRVT